MNLNPPTARQLEVLRTILGHARRRGFAPTIRELGDELGIRSTNGVQCHLQLLTKKGLVIRQRGSARTLQLTEAGLRAVG